MKQVDMGFWNFLLAYDRETTAIHIGYTMIVEFEDRYSESPYQSLNKTAVTTFINSSISVYDSMPQSLAAKIHQKMTTFSKKTSWNY